MAGSPRASRFTSLSLGFLLCGIESQSWHRAVLRINKRRFRVSAWHSARTQGTLLSVPRPTACQDCALTGYRILGRFLCSEPGAGRLAGHLKKTQFLLSGCPGAGERGASVLGQLGRDPARQKQQEGRVRTPPLGLRQPRCREGTRGHIPTPRIRKLLTCK